MLVRLTLLPDGVEVEMLGGGGARSTLVVSPGKEWRGLSHDDLVKLGDGEHQLSNPIPSSLPTISG